MMQQSHAKNTVDRCITEIDSECRCLKGMNASEDIFRLGAASDSEHVRRIVSGENYPIGFFRKRRPETPSAAGEIKNQTWVACDRQGSSSQLLVTHVG